MERRIDMSGQRVLVTGTGTGGGIARRMALWGAVVAATDINLERAQATLAAIEADGGSGGVAACWKSLGGIDLLTNNAGVLTFDHVVALSLDDCNHVLGVNLTGVFNLCRAPWPAA